jgi:hypothetical protein
VAADRDEPDLVPFLIYCVVVFVLLKLLGF